MSLMDNFKSKVVKKVLHKEDKRKLVKLIEGQGFDNFIMWLIFADAVVLGLLTTGWFSYSFDRGLFLLNRLFLALFLVEILLKLYVKNISFFKSGWNVFDFLVVFSSVIPSFGALIVLRTFRLMKPLKEQEQVKKMAEIAKVFVALLPTFFSFMLMFAVMIFVFSVIGVVWYGEIFADFATLGSSMLVMLQSFTVDAWNMDIARPVLTIFPSAWIFFTALNLCAFLLVISFVVSAFNQIVSAKK